MSQPTMFKFRLYVAGDTQNSMQAVANLTALCDVRLPNRHKIELVDVFLEPKRAFADAIFMTPTLLKLAPSPVQKIVGTLSESGRIMDLLGLRTMAV